jgi:Fe-S oxidoreductase
MGKKMNMERTDEALASASDTLAVGCPFCNIMLSDGVTERHADEQMSVRDVAQILLQSVDSDDVGAGAGKTVAAERAGDD